MFKFKWNQHSDPQEKHRGIPILTDRQALERKVEEGTKKAIEEYGEVFKRLAAYDRT